MLQFNYTAKHNDKATFFGSPLFFRGYLIATAPVHIIETDEAGQVCFAVQNLAAVRSQMGIESSLNENEAILKIEEIRNAPSPEPEASAEERIAAALEYQNLTNM